MRAAGSRCTDPSGLDARCEKPCLGLTDQDDAVPMRGERCSQGEACDVGFDLRTRVSVVGIAKFNANSTA